MHSDPQSSSVNQLWQEFKKVINKVVLDHLPHKVNISRNRLPWINKQIKKDIKVQKHLYNKAKRSNSQDDWEAYRKIKNSINTTLKEAHNIYYRRLLIIPLVVTVDNFGSTLELNVKTGTISLFINDQPIHSATGKANALNNQSLQKKACQQYQLWMVILMYLACLISLSPNLEYTS